MTEADKRKRGVLLVGWIISDSHRDLINAYGVDRLGGLIPIPKRVIYVIDRKGIVRAVIHHEFIMQRHAYDVR